MPRGPKGEHRPADTHPAPVLGETVASGEIEHVTVHDGKNAAAVVLGRMGGKARAQVLGKRKRVEIARKAAEKRWQEKRKTR